MADNARDMLNFLLRYLPPRESALKSSLPVYLPRVPEEVERARDERGLDGERTLVMIGQSLGGVSGYVLHPNIISEFSRIISFILDIYSFVSYDPEIHPN